MQTVIMVHYTPEINQTEMLTKSRELFPYKVYAHMFVLAMK